MTESTLTYRWIEIEALVQSRRAKPIAENLPQHWQLSAYPMRVRRDGDTLYVAVPDFLEARTLRVIRKMDPKAMLKVLPLDESTGLPDPASVDPVLAMFRVLLEAWTPLSEGEGKLGDYFDVATEAGYSLILDRYRKLDGTYGFIATVSSIKPQPEVGQRSIKAEFPLSGNYQSLVASLRTAIQERQREVWAHAKPEVHLDELKARLAGILNDYADRERSEYNPQVQAAIREALERVAGDLQAVVGEIAY